MFRSLLCSLLVIAGCGALHAAANKTADDLFLDDVEHRAFR
jgi:hypothetical protein